MSEDLPLVTLAIPVRNEEAHLRTCLDSIAAGDYPTSRLEALVVDGRSADRSRDIVATVALTHPWVRLLDNPRRLQAPAFNLALREARGEVFIRVDAHTTYAPDYVSECVRLLRTTGADCVGGVQLATGDTPFTRAVAVAVSSPFAAGDARYRYADAAMWVDTVYLGAWWTRRLRELGGMNEQWAVNEDYELNYRLRMSGGRILLSPTIRSEYRVRATAARLIRQYLRYGFWRARTVAEHPASLRWRQVVAPALVVGLAAGPCLRGILGIAAWAPWVAYGAGLLVASLVSGRNHRLTLSARLPFLFAAIHLSWGTGFLVGIVRWSLRRLGRA